MKHNTILITAILSIVLAMSVFMNSREVVGVENHDDVNIISFLESQDCEVVYTENYVCQAQRGRVDPRGWGNIVNQRKRKYDKDPSDWNCFMLCLAIGAAIYSMNAANKKDQK